MAATPNSGQSQAAVFFDGFAGTFDTLYDHQRGTVMRWLDRTFRSDIELRYQLTFERLGDLVERSVLDIGCGSGPYLVAALKQGADRVTGLDPAAGMLTLARARLERAGIAGNADLKHGLFPDTVPEAHDYAIVMGVLDYVQDAERFLTVLRTVVTRGAAVSFPSRHWLRTPIRDIRYRLRNCPLYFYDEQDIRGLAKAAGFGGVRIQKIPGAGQDYHVWLTV